MMVHVLGEIALFPYDFTPKGYLRCDGQTLQTADFPELSSLLGKKFGGDGVKTFALPDYRNRIQARLGSESLAYYIAVEAVEGAVPREGHVPWREREIGQIALLAFELKDWGPSWLPVDGRSIASTELLYDLLPNGMPNLAGSAPAGSHYAMLREGIYPSGSRVEMLSGVLTGEIRLFPDYRNDFKPAGWIECDGSKMAVKQHTLLSSYLGERFGGRYPVFELPDLTDSAPAGHRYRLCLKGMYPIRP